MIVTIGNSKKGGEGKSTISTNLAVTLSKRGLEVIVLDLDPENTAAYDFFKSRKQNDISCYKISDPLQMIDILRYEIEKPTSKTIFILDIAGVESGLTSGAIGAADLLLSPLRVTKYSILAFHRFIDFLPSIFTDGKIPPLYMIPNFTKGKKERYKQDLKPLETAGYKIAALVADRNDYANSAWDGLSAAEFGNKDAAKEINEIANVVEKHAKLINQGKEND